MRRTLLSMLCLLAVGTFAMKAQMFTVSPSPVQMSSENVVITFDDTQALDAGNSPWTTKPTALYAHIGVGMESAPTAWSHVKYDWGKNYPDNTFVSKGNGKWELTIGNIREYFGLAENEKAVNICIIARNASGNIQTKDVFLPIAEEGYISTMTHDATSTAFTSATTVNFTLTATQASTLTIKLNGSQVATASNSTKLSKALTFSAPGSYEVEGIASNGTETQSNKLTFMYIKQSPAATYPGGVPKMGPVAQANGDVIFCLAAPSKSSVVLVPSWDDYQVLDKNIMSYQDYNGYRYFWTKVSGLDPNKRYPYYFIVDGNIKVGDPYAKLVLDPYSDKWIEKDCGAIFTDRPAYPSDKVDESEGVCLAVYHGNQDKYDWKVTNFDIPDPRSMVIYELCLRDFTGTDYASDGSFVKAMEKIPYLEELGVNAVELMPVMEFNGNSSWGYNNNFYMAPDKTYGSPDDMKAFIDLCHSRGIAVILDIVFNQSDGLAPWYKMYPAATNPFYNATAPHAYSVLNDWKQEYPLVRQHWEDVIKYWMTEYKVDGFRFDLVKGLGDSDSYKSGTDVHNASRVANMKRLNDVIKSVNPKGIHINELLLNANSEDNANFANGGQMGWNNQNSNARDYASGSKTPQQTMKWISSVNCSRTANALVSYAESHDEERMGYTQKSTGWGKTAKHADRMKRLATVAPMLLLVPDATPMIWQFGELGADESITANGDRVNSKKVLWSYMNDADRMGVHDAYKAAATLRTNNPELFEDAATSFTSTVGENTNFKYMKLTNGTREIIAFINPSTTSSYTVSLNGPAGDPKNYTIVAHSKGWTPSLANCTTSRVSISGLPANGYIILASPAVKTEPAAIDNVAADTEDAAFTVTAEGGSIIVTGVYNNVTVFDTLGRQTAMSGLTPGVYYVNVDGKTTKLLVK
ncbi:MAG: alpha-amylase family glycosyl hydrolase [Candidatus Amulumruptor caecigallinarius]|nr:alpha-amylase family glycosyl hydrolase [Candidatus Amulumruptor caecigallinarius]MCM1396583.1 alpha-amylase family glycosyl hydrolase [Candidatus Amulumruptor caecigallinarius]MCM1453359.1 alpha-amylase family glycosyl hydrolase [bacterium]